MLCSLAYYEWTFLIKRYTIIKVFHTVIHACYQHNIGPYQMKGFQFLPMAVLSQLAVLLILIANLEVDHLVLCMHMYVIHDSIIIGILRTLTMQLKIKTELTRKPLKIMCQFLYKHVKKTIQ